MGWFHCNPVFYLTCYSQYCEAFPAASSAASVCAKRQKKHLVVCFYCWFFFYEGCPDKPFKSNNWNFEQWSISQSNIKGTQNCQLWRQQIRIFSTQSIAATMGIKRRSMKKTEQKNFIVVFGQTILCYSCSFHFPTPADYTSSWFYPTLSTKAGFLRGKNEGNPE